ncbi:D-Ala-D-Ala carboxypeptidase family metallohydrolase [Sphaerothrix gracilis]|uniref:D-Ala-D-Ala carboxypeptidase family metallohydrolase n=1 Tax=Sphaerothrix gracilis TaxID=3151835 RepID=UPI0031FE13C8
MASEETDPIDKESPTSDETRLKIWELKLKEKELQIASQETDNKYKLERFRIIAVGVVVTLVTSIVNWQIQHQQVEIERLKSEAEYLENFAQKALQEDLEKRYYFAEYLSIIAHSRGSRDRWNSYKNAISKRIDEKNQKIAAIESLEREIEESSRSEQLPKNEFEALEQEIEKKEQELSELRAQSQLISPDTGASTEFKFEYDLDDKIIPDANFTWRDAIQKSGHTSIPVDQEVVNNIIKVARVLKEIQEKYEGKPITTNSWYRNPTHNQRVGGLSSSRHLAGDAVDFNVEGIDPAVLYDDLDEWWGSKGGLASSSVFVHIDVRGYRARWSYGY